MMLFTQTTEDTETKASETAASTETDVSEEELRKL